MTLDQRLTRAVHHVATTVTAPDVDLDALRTKARANRHRTIAVAAAAVVVAVIAVGVVVIGGRDTSTPAPVEPIPSPQVVGRGPVWYDEAGLHHGDTVEQTPVELLESGSGELALVRGGALYRDPATDDVWFHPWGGEPRIVGHGSLAGPGGDPGGDVAAWFEDSELVVYDTARGREISRTEEAQVLDRAGTEHVTGGNGFLHVSVREVVWRSELAVNRLDLPTGTSSILSETLRIDDRGSEIEVNPRPDDVHEGTQVWVDLRRKESQLRVEVAGRGSLELPDVEPMGRLSADGTFLLSPEGDDGTHGAAIVDLRTGETWKLLEGGFYAYISWAYGDVAVVKVDLEQRDTERLLACDAVKRECQPLPTHGNLVLPTS